MIPAVLTLLTMPSGHLRWADRELAGYVMSSEKSDVAVYDPATKFFLVRSSVCDGADLTLLLTRDRQEAQEMMSGALVQKKLPPLSTGKGVKIGDFQERIVSLLGLPTTSKLTGNRKQFLTLEYKGKLPGGDIRTDDYTFKHGRLIEIEFNRDVDQE